MLGQLFDLVNCPRCGCDDWHQNGSVTCARCDYEASVTGRFVSLLPDHLSSNNAREAAAFDDNDEATKDELIRKPDALPPLMREQILADCAIMAKVAADLPKNASILFLFSGGGMEAHLSGLLGNNVVLADISMPLHRIAYERFEHYGAPQPLAFVACDAERLPFKTDSFDYVIGFEGIHHCLVPQAALAEIWRVARGRALIVDNYECWLTRFMYRFGLSSQVEGSGVMPNRFTYQSLETMLFNAGIKCSDFTPRASVPPSLHRIGYWPTKALTAIFNFTGQANMFMLITEKNKLGEKFFGEPAQSDAC